MKSKIIFLDVDGTLALASGDVSHKVKQAIQKARENGHYVFICTGRNRAGIERFMPIGFDGVICSAGGYIEINNKKIYESFLSAEDFQEARDIFNEHHMLCHCESTYLTFCDEELGRIFLQDLMNDKNNSELERLKKEQENQFDICSFEEYDQNPVPIHKISFVSKNKDDVEAIKEKLSYKYNFVIHEIFSDVNINGEIIIKGTNKGKAVLKVVEALNMNIEDTICFGDSMNDLEMIQACFYSVVMENGSEELKKYATTVCESVSNDGVYHEMNRLGLLK